MLSAELVTSLAKELFHEERAITRLDGWFLMRESYMKNDSLTEGMSESYRAAFLLKKAVETLPLSVSSHAVFAGTQRDAFARSYALINPSFRVETFSGYCDPTAVYGDIDSDETFPSERISTVRDFDSRSPYVRELTETYAKAENHTSEVIYFIEQVTGHVIPDIRPILRDGIRGVREKIRCALMGNLNEKQRDQYAAMELTLDAAEILASRYRALAEEQLKNADSDSDRERFTKMIRTLERVPAEDARDLHEAIQSFLLVWQLMCLEQAPNPFAFSVGNADRIFEPYRAMTDCSREDTAALLKEDFESYSVNADFGAGEHFNNQSLPEGGIVTRTVKDGGSTKYMEMLAKGDGSRNRFKTNNSFSGTYTLEFDYCVANNTIGSRLIYIPQ